MEKRLKRIILDRFILPLTKRFSRKQKIFLVAGCLMIGVWMIVAIPLPKPLQMVWYLTGNNAPEDLAWPYEVLAYTGEAGIIGFGCLFLFLLFISVSDFIQNKPGTFQLNLPSHENWLFYTLPMIVAWTIFLLAFWPGLMTTDSMDIWQQVLSGQFDDAHPMFNQFMLWVITYTWRTPGLFLLFQILFLAFTISWIIGMLRKRGIPIWGAWGISFFCALSPVNLAMVNTLWKDIPYSIFTLLFFGMLFRLIDSNGAVLKHFPIMLGMGSAALGMILYRHEGIYIVILSIIMLAVIYRHYWLKIGLMFLVVFGLQSIIKSFITQEFNVTHPPDQFFMGAKEAHLIGAYLAAGTPLTIKEKEYINQIMPLEGHWNYDCTYAGAIIIDEDFSWEPIYKNPQQLFNITLALTKRNPLVFVQHHVCYAALVWKLLYPRQGIFPRYAINFKADGTLYTLNDQTHVPLKTTPILPDLTYPLAYYVTSSSDHLYSFLIWHPSLYFYILIFFMLVYLPNKKMRNLVIPIIPVLLQVLLMIVSNISSDFRYYYPLYLVASTYGVAFLFFYPWLNAAQENQRLPE